MDDNISLKSRASSVLQKKLGVDFSKASEAIEKAVQDLVDVKGISFADAEQQIYEKTISAYEHDEYNV